MGVDACVMSREGKILHTSHKLLGGESDRELVYDTVPYIEDYGQKLKHKDIMSGIGFIIPELHRRGMAIEDIEAQVKSREFDYLTTKYKGDSIPNLCRILSIFIDCGPMLAEDQDNYLEFD